MCLTRITKKLVLWLMIVVLTKLLAIQNPLLSQGEWPGMSISFVLWLLPEKELDLTNNDNNKD